MTSPWAVPAPVSQFSLKDADGDTVIWLHGGLHQSVPTRDFGQKPAARGTVIVLTGRFAGQVEEDQMIFSARPLGQISQLQPAAAMLCRVRVNRSMSFDPPGAYEEQIAAQWMAAHPGELDRLRQAAVAMFHQAERRLITAMPLQHGPAQSPLPPSWATGPVPGAPSAPYAPQPAPQPVYGPPWPTPAPAPAPPAFAPAPAGQAAPMQPSTVADAPTMDPLSAVALAHPGSGHTVQPQALVAAFTGAPALGADGYPVADISPTDALAAYGPNGAGVMVPPVAPAPAQQTGY